jgi:hypothetical protein
MSLAEPASLTNASPQPSFWKTTPGDGYRKGTGEAGFALGAGFGISTLGSTERHDLALANFHLGWMITDPVFEGTWLRGNWELGGDSVIVF